MTTSDAPDFERTAALFAGVTPELLRAVYAVGRWLAAPEPPYDFSAVSDRALAQLERRGLTRNIRDCASAERRKRWDHEESERRRHAEEKRAAFLVRRDLFLAELSMLCRKHDVTLSGRTGEYDEAEIEVDDGCPDRADRSRFVVSECDDSIVWRWFPRPATEAELASVVQNEREAWSVSDFAQAVEVRQ
jgi:hypothetical protein